MEIDIFPKKASKTGNYAGRFGGSSTQVVELDVEYHGLTFTAAVWARKNRDRNTGEERIEIEANLPTGLKFGSDEEQDEFKEVALASAEVYAGYKAAEERAIARLNSPGTTVSKTRKTIPVVGQTRQTDPAASAPAIEPTETDESESL